MIDTWDQVNLRAVYTVPGMENLSVSVAVRNLTKEDPPLSQAGEYNRFIHNNLGMQTFVGFTLEL
jgi:outer membrane receptor protein involved in Fe transport